MRVFWWEGLIYVCFFGYQKQSWSPEKVLQEKIHENKSH